MSSSSLILNYVKETNILAISISKHHQMFYPLNQQIYLKYNYKQKYFQISEEGEEKKESCIYKFLVYIPKKQTYIKYIHI